MAKKMAVKTRPNKPKKSLEFGMPAFARRLIKLTVVLSLLAGIGFLITIIPGAWSGIWPVEKIAIVGEVEHLEQYQLAKIISAKEFSGMLSVDLQQLRNKVIQLPWVKDVQIRKVWPDTLSFRVKEHQVIALVNQAYLTDDGDLIERGSYISKRAVLKLEIDKVQLDKQPDLLALYNKLKKIQSSLAGRQLSIEKLEISQTNNWLIQIKNKFLIKAGRKQQLQRIEKFLQVYVVIKNKSKLMSVDLRYSNGLAVKFADEVSEPGQNG
jgi:cell division protein FtsQ